MSRIPIILPPLGMKSEEIQFGSWLVELGAVVNNGDDFYEVEADKATVVCEAEASGVFAEAVVSEGKVKEGDVLGFIDA
jgi:pyruvate/2-oxoglutarate dehydrogenase complex dihydrolipoamide acyltransferase (E2) component